MKVFKYLDENGALETIKSNSVLLSTPSKYNDPSKKSNIAIKVLNRINSEGKLDYNDYVALYDAIISIS